MLEATPKVGFGPYAPKAQKGEPNDYLLQLQARSAYGMLKSMAATLSEKDSANPVTLKAILERFPRLMQFGHNDALWANDIRDKLKRKRLGL